MPDLFLDGSWVSPAEGGTRVITCPADGTVVGIVDEATEADTAAAIGAARTAFDDGTWPATLGLTVLLSSGASPICC